MKTSAEVHSQCAENAKLTLYAVSHNGMSMNGGTPPQCAWKVVCVDGSTPTLTVCMTRCSSCPHGKKTNIHELPINKEKRDHAGIEILDHAGNGPDSAAKRRNIFAPIFPLREL